MASYTESTGEVVNTADYGLPDPGQQNTYTYEPIEFDDFYTDPSTNNDYGYSSSGYGTTPAAYGSFFNSPSTYNASWADSYEQMKRNNPFLSMAASFIPGIGKVKAGLDVASKFSRGDMLGGVVGGLGMVAPGLGSNLARGAVEASRGNLGPMGGTLAANMVGRATGNGGLAQLAGWGGSQLANMAGRERGGNPVEGSGPQMNAGNGGGNGDMDFGAIAQGLGSIYSASQANKGVSSAGAGNAAVQQQISQLSGMYSQDSPYANHMRQVLERKDAAAGRRSQYGPREAQLQAALAEKQHQVAQTIGNLSTSNQTNQLALQDRRNQTRGQQLALVTNMARTLPGMFSRMGGGGQPMERVPQASDYAQGGPSSNYYAQQPNVGGAPGVLEEEFYLGD